MLRCLEVSTLFIISVVLMGCGSDGFELNEDAQRSLDTSSIRIDPLSVDNFTFNRDVGDRSDKVIGRMQFTVADLSNGGFVGDLDGDSFEFSERDFGAEDEFITEVEATQGSELEVTPIDVLYLIDRSFSVVQSGAGDDLIEQANNLANRINQTNSANSSLSNGTQFITFADRVSSVQRSFSSDTPFSSLTFEEQGGGTALYQAMQLALNSFSANTVNPLLFVFTDGRENASAIGFDKASVVQAAEGLGIPIFIAGLGDVVDKAALEEIARSSGGSVAIAKTVDELATAFDDVLRNIPVEYTVIYRPTQRTGHREFKFTVNNSDTTGFILDDFNVDTILQ